MKDDVFAVIADPTRRHILQSLAVERLAVGELVEELGVSQPTVSKHLKVLRHAGLVKTEALGQKRFYSLVTHPLEKVVRWIDALGTAAPLPAEPANPVAETERSEGVDEPEVTEPQREEPADMTEESQVSEPEESALLEDEAAEAPPTFEAEPLTDTATEPETAEVTAPVAGETVGSSEGETAETEAAEEPAVEAIHFTPLAPFTPGSLTAPVDTALDTAGSAEPSVNQAEGLEDPDHTPAEVLEPKLDSQPERSDKEEVSEVKPPAPVYAEDKLAVPQIEADERGIFARLTRLRRRTSR